MSTRVNKGTNKAEAALRVDPVTGYLRPEVVLTDESGADLTLSSTPQLAAGENHVGQVSTDLPVQKAPDALAVTASSAYAAGNVLGGVLKFTNALRSASAAGSLVSLLLIDAGNQKAPIDLLIFSGNPTQGTYTDKSACPSFVTNSTDRGKIIRRVSIAAADYVTIGSVAFVDLSVALRILPGGSADLYALMVIATGGAPTYLTTGDLALRLGILQG